MRSNTRLFLIIWIAGLIGVVSFLLVDLNAMLASIPFPEGTEVPNFTLTLKVLSLIQPAVLVGVAALIGVLLARKVGLSAPVSEALAEGTDARLALKRQVAPGILGGIIGGVAIIISGFAAREILPPEITERISHFGQFLPLITRLLYGGLTEEVLLRWGVMTLIVWIVWRVFQKGTSTPSSAVVILSILTSSVLFAIGHLPIAFLLFPDRTIALTIFVIIGNSLFGLVAGFLYWRKGLESAIIAHGLTHVILFSATYLGAYF